ncbi:MAG: hypothetical protein GF307_11725 [candidate division Zixibacteria bacterium]|nr:hypothetical protein [candidate division Zixibacteria bacterium]
MGINDFGEENGSPRNGIIKSVATILLSVAAVIAAYYSTVSSLKVAIASKADRTEISMLERRLNSVENCVEQNFITRDDFHRFSEEVNYRLLKIEFKLENLVEGEIDGRKK